MTDGPLTGEPLNTSGKTFGVEQCAACDGKHVDLEMHEFNRKPVPFTHYYHCPTLGDPVSVCLAQMKAGSGMELTGPICQALAEAQLCGRYIVVVGFYDHSGNMIVKKSTFKFPVVDYFETPDHKNFMGNLRELLESETGRQPVVMREAAIPEPLVNLRGRQTKDIETHKVVQPNGDGAVKPAEQS